MRVLEAARNVPSTNNSQPWNVVVVQGEARQRLQTAMLEKFDEGSDGKASYQNRPKEMQDRMKSEVGMFFSCRSARGVDIGSALALHTGAVVGQASRAVRPIAHVEFAGMFYHQDHLMLHTPLPFPSPYLPDGPVVRRAPLMVGWMEIG